MAKEKEEIVKNKKSVFENDLFILCAFISVTNIVCTAIKTFGGKKVNE